MCGICGAISPTLTPGHFQKITDTLAHRGPDDAGSWREGLVFLGHRRLSIIDLSANGHQPMLSPDGRLVLIFNGEIYNFRELRAELNDYAYRSNTDSEVILAAYARWGKDCVKRFNGMFAFAIYDRQAETLFIARDRLGIKPLYYYQEGSQFIFASEVRALLAFDLVTPRIDPDSLADYLRYQTVHAPRTILKDIYMLPPAHCWELRPGDFGRPEAYWSPLEATTNANGQSRNRADWKKAVFETLQKAVERRLVSDVPFGAFLSGGIDSSAVVALMARAGQSVKTFNVSFAEEEFSEARYARIIAEKFHTDHHEIHLSPGEFLHQIPDALAAMDHPSADGPNTWVVSKATREAGITMALSGLGGDELFAGYPIFRRAVRLERLSGLHLLPVALRKWIGAGLRQVRPGIESAKVAQILALPEFGAMNAYPVNRQAFLDPQLQRLLTFDLPSNRVVDILQAYRKNASFQQLPLLSQVSVAEISTYMQNVLLRDTDQMTMAHALEVRVPFLDHELVELALQIPDREKYPHTPKQLLVESLGELLPPEIVHRPKMGFTLPFAQWMKHELRDFCAHQLEVLMELPSFRRESLQAYWQDFLSGHPDVSWSRIWSLVVLGYWLERHGVQ